MNDIARRQAENGKAPAQPSPGQHPGLFLRLSTGRAGRSAAATNDDLAQAVAVHLPGRDQRDIHHGDHTTRSCPGMEGRSAARPATREQRPNMSNAGPDQLREDIHDQARRVGVWVRRRLRPERCRTIPAVTRRSGDDRALGHRLGPKCPRPAALPESGRRQPPGRCLARRVIEQQTARQLALTDRWNADKEERPAERRRGQERRPQPAQWLIQYSLNRSNLDGVHR
ncbi:hypothetical protein [Streptomyces eurythermus]|uniref:hypothetical protein n=1 Tax=Streptomyces eurythermus TaxID=42237 RepID=UPI0036F95792